MFGREKVHGEPNWQRRLGYAFLGELHIPGSVARLAHDQRATTARLLATDTDHAAGCRWRRRGVCLLLCAAISALARGGR